MKEASAFLWRESRHGEGAGFTWSEHTLNALQFLHNDESGSTYCIDCKNGVKENGTINTFILLILTCSGVKKKKEKSCHLDCKKTTSPKRSQLQLLIASAVEQSSDGCQARSKWLGEWKEGGSFVCFCADSAKVTEWVWELLPILRGCLVYYQDRKRAKWERGRNWLLCGGREKKSGHRIEPSCVPL